jgi:hypothetical protein
MAPLSAAAPPTPSSAPTVPLPRPHLAPGASAGKVAASATNATASKAAEDHDDDLDRLLGISISGGGGGKVRCCYNTWWLPTLSVLCASSANARPQTQCWMLRLDICLTLFALFDDVQGAPLGSGIANNAGPAGSTPARTPTSTPSSQATKSPAAPTAAVNALEDWLDSM